MYIGGIHFDDVTSYANPTLLLSVLNSLRELTVRYEHSLPGCHTLQSSVRSVVVDPTIVVYIYPIGRLLNHFGTRKKVRPEP